MMKCSSCNTKNRVYANYCIKCSHKFSKEEQKKAKSKTFVGKLESIEKWYKRLTLKVITDHIVFKIGSIICILAIGLYFLFTNGNSLKLIKSDNYLLNYNKNKKEYYLIVDNLEEIPLNLYVPYRCKNINIIHYDEDGNVIENKKYKNDDKIILKTNALDYYIVKANYSKNDKEEFKLYVYNKDDIKYE